MSEKQKKYYLYIDGQAVPVSEQVYRTYHHYGRKEEYFTCDLKTEKVSCDQEAQTAAFTPSREDSYERLLEANQQFALCRPIPGGRSNSIHLAGGPDARPVLGGTGHHHPTLCVGQNRAAGQRCLGLGAFHLPSEKAGPA